MYGPGLMITYKFSSWANLTKALVKNKKTTIVEYRIKDKTQDLKWKWKKVRKSGQLIAMQSDWEFCDSNTITAQIGLHSILAITSIDYKLNYN